MLQLYVFVKLWTNQSWVNLLFSVPRDLILHPILDSFFPILDSQFVQESRIANCVENQNSQRTVNLLLNGTVTVWMVDWLTGKLLNLLTDWLTFWMVDRWTDGLTDICWCNCNFFVIFLQIAHTIVTINLATDSQYVSELYCRICDHNYYSSVHLAFDLAFYLSLEA